MPFQKGQSGNPKGRKPGSPDRRTVLFQELLPYGDHLVAKAVALALDGDQQMLSLCLNKLIPNPKPVERAVPLDASSGSLTEHGEQAIHAALTGRIAPGEASALLGALQAQAKLVEADELARRVEALERAAGQN